jgi:beta-N-acetylhexosaminidase
MKILIRILFMSLISFSFSQDQNPLMSEDYRKQKKWTDSIYTSLTLDEKIGQLFMPIVFSKHDESHKAEILNLINKYHIGGLIFSLGNPHKHAKWLNEFQNKSKTPLLIGMDAEWGVSMRLDSVIKFPWSMTLGAINDNSIIRKIGKRMGEQEKLLGINISFSPVLDLNTNPNNPIIGNRSFGQDKSNVTSKAIALMQGIQEAGVLTSGKHFPGHGDTYQDSHKELPLVNFTRERLNEIEIYPYKRLISKGLSSIMIAHLNVPELTGKNKVPTSLSYEVVTELLKKEMGFKGLIFSDAMNMKGVLDNKKYKNVDLSAFQAGNDIILVSNNVPLGIKKIKTAYKNKKISESRLEESVKKILMAKYKAGLSDKKIIENESLFEKLNTKLDTILVTEAFKKSVTLLSNENDLLPLDENKKYAHIKLGDDSGQDFLERLKKYGIIKSINPKLSLSEIENELKEMDKVIISLHRKDDNPYRSENFFKSDINLIKSISEYKKVILNVFVKPYTLRDLDKITGIDALVVSYQNNPICQKVSADKIFGIDSYDGKLPVSASSKFKVGDGILLESINKLRLSSSLLLGFDPNKLKEIDRLAEIAIDSLMTPGLQIFISRKGKIIYNKSFGHHTYKKNLKVKNEHIYDLASLTKILAALPLVITEVDRGELNIEDTIGELIQDYKGSNKSSITIKEILSHYARLVPWIPFYKETLGKNSFPKRKYYRKSKSNRFSVPVTENLYLRSNYFKKIDKIIKNSPLLDTLEYRYSDLAFFIVKKYFDKKYNKSLQQIVRERIYKPLGLKRTMYNPAKIIPAEEIVPSELDTYFRHGELRGYVHDMGAAMQSGIGGHAGLFSNATEVGVIMQMFLKKGKYDGEILFDDKTFDLFNYCYYCGKGNRRGVGFDKPQIEGRGSTCGCVSPESFGHMGFTGTYAWADPEHEIVYVFLSNRTYPTMSNNLLGDHDIRTRIQEIIYDSIIY